MTTTILNTLVWNWIWFDQFTAIAINEKEMLNKNLTDSIICYWILRSCLNSSYILWQLSAPSVYSVLWSVHSVISTSRVAFQSVWYRLCLHSRWCVRMCNICLEIHFIDVCIWFYCLCNRCKWWIWFEVVTFKHVCVGCVCLWWRCVCE